MSECISAVSIWTSDIWTLSSSHKSQHSVSIFTLPRIRVPGPPDHYHPDHGHHPPGLLMIYSLHLPQAMRGTTLNEQHKPHSLMSNFSIVSEVLTDLWFVLGRDHHLIIDVASLPRCCLVTRDDKLTWSLTSYQNHPAQDPGRAWNQWKPISNLLLASC